MPSTTRRAHYPARSTSAQRWQSRALPAGFYATSFAETQLGWTAKPHRMSLPSTSTRLIKRLAWDGSLKMAEEPWLGIAAVLFDKLANRVASDPGEETPGPT